MIFSLIIAWIVFVILWKMIKTTFKTALTLAALLVLLQVAFGITPQDIWQQIQHLPQTLSQIRGSK
jgi:predicted PurR-regulated permease PerM